MPIRSSLPRRQHGSILVLVGMSLAVLIGFLGLVVDLGRLFVTKAELQTAMDSCALAAAAELKADADAVNRAVSAAMTAGNRNKVGLQGDNAGITPADVYFSDHLSNNSTTFPYGYLSAAAANPATAKYAMCARSQTGIQTWFMQALEGWLGETSQSKAVAAVGTATLAPAQTNCAIPLAVCAKGGAPSYGLVKGDWVSGRFDAGGGVTGSFNWLDLGTVNGENGANAVTSVLSGQGTCNLSKTTLVGKTGSLGNNAAKAWNSRFGLYQGGGGNPNIDTAPPDYTGYAYTASNWLAQSNAYPNFRAKRAAFASYGDTTDTVTSGNNLTQLTISNAYSVATHGSGGQLSAKGADRRVVTAPIVDCTAWVSAQKVPIADFACVLMLHPIDKPNDLVRMEYLGKASELGTPCSTFGLAGGTVGPMVPVLVH